MRRKAGQIFPRERAFIAQMATTQDRNYAAEKAGYPHPTQAAAQLLQRPAVIAEIARIQTEKLFQEVLPAAINCLASIIASPTAPAGARVQAAKVVLERTLGADGAAQTKEPHEMTPEELAEQIAKLERMAAERAKDVTPPKVQEAGIFD
jgi:hypothetical protein